MSGSVSSSITDQFRFAAAGGKGNLRVLDGYLF